MFPFSDTHEYPFKRWEGDVRVNEQRFKLPYNQKTCQCNVLCALIHLIKPPHDEKKNLVLSFSHLHRSFFSLFYFFKCWSSWWEGSFDTICCEAKFSNGKCNAIQQQAFSNICMRQWELYYVSRETVLTIICRNNGDIRQKRAQGKRDT